MLELYIVTLKCWSFSQIKMKRKPKENKIEQAQSIDLLYRISKAMATVKDGREGASSIC